MPINSEKKPTLLLVDDDAIIADSLEYVLSEEYQVERANDRPSSFALIDAMKEPPTLALVDLGLPPNIHRPDEGLAVVRKLSQKHPSTRVLVLSGQDTKKHLFQAREDGAVDFIAKPCDIAEIKVRLKKQIVAGGGAGLALAPAGFSVGGRVVAAREGEAEREDPSKTQSKTHAAA